jgi:hypothetical protein
LQPYPTVTLPNNGYIPSQPRPYITPVSLSTIHLPPSPLPPTTVFAGIHVFPARPTAPDLSPPPPLGDRP